MHMCSGVCRERNQFFYRLEGTIRFDDADVAHMREGGYVITGGQLGEREVFLAAEAP